MMKSGVYAFIQYDWVDDVWIVTTGQAEVKELREKTYQTTTKIKLLFWIKAVI